MNVYDFDNTILRGDSTALFFRYCLARCPKMWLDVPKQAWNGLLFVLKLKEKQAFKQEMLSFLMRIGDVDAVVASFWEKNFRRVKPWYLKKHRDDDVIISASPEFLIRPACDRLGIRHVMGSPVDKHTGRFFGKNCHGAEKTRRFREVWGDTAIDAFYSDSRSDSPLAEIAREAWLVKGNRLMPW